MLNRQYLYLLPIMGLVLFLTDDCKKDKELVKLPVVTTSDVIGITSNRAFCEGTISTEVPVPVTECGVCWSTTRTPTIADNKLISKSGVVGLGNFTCEIKGLTSNSAYFVSAYATNNAGTAYGKVLSFTTTPTVTDIDGNVYSTVTFGTQTWMAENLKTSRYRNGDSIPNVTDNTGWNTLSTGACCVYNNDEKIGAIYGKLYNEYAVQDNRNIAPEGWHVPTIDEWTTLITFLGGPSISAQKMKQTGYIYWGDLNECGLRDSSTNSSGFTALGAGYRLIEGNFSGLREITYFFSSISTEVYYPYCILLNCANWLEGIYMAKNFGFSVRCIKDH